MTERVLVLSADAWTMQDDKTGEVKKGVSCWYVNNYRDDSEGQKPTKCAILPELLPALNGKLPAICDLDYGSRPGAKNVATLTIIACSVVKSVDLLSMFAVK